MPSVAVRQTPARPAETPEERTARLRQGGAALAGLVLLIGVPILLIAGLAAVTNQANEEEADEASPVLRRDDPPPLYQATQSPVAANETPSSETPSILSTTDAVSEALPAYDQSIVACPVTPEAPPIMPAAFPVISSSQVNSVAPPVYDRSTVTRPRIAEEPADPPIVLPTTSSNLVSNLTPGRAVRVQARSSPSRTVPAGTSWEGTLPSTQSRLHVEHPAIQFAPKSAAYRYLCSLAIWTFFCISSGALLEIHFEDVPIVGPFTQIFLTGLLGILILGAASVGL